MIKENETELLVALYGIFYFSLLDLELVDEQTAKEYKKPNELFENDIIQLYIFLAERTKHLSKKDLQKNAEKFNNFVKQLFDTYNSNQFLLGMFIMEHYLLTEPKDVQILYLSKLTRVIKEWQKKIEKHNSKEKSKEIFIDTSRAASNIYRLFNGQAQLTKEIRDSKIKQWKEAARKRSNKLKDIYSLET